MVDCVDGFPHGGVVSDIGGFLSERQGGGGGTQDMTMGVTTFGGMDPFGFPIINDYDGNFLGWVGTTVPPVGSSTLEVDLQPMYEASYYWYQDFAWRTAPDPDEHPWLIDDGVERTIMILHRKDVGHLVVWLPEVTALPVIDTLISEQSTALNLMINDAVSAGKAIYVENVLLDSTWHRVAVGINRTSTTTATMDVTVYADDNTTILGSGTGIYLDNTTEWGGFDPVWGWYPPLQTTPFLIGMISQARLVVPDGCPLAAPLPEFTPRVLELDTPSACDTGMTTPDEPYSGPFLPNFKVSIPIGDTPEKFSLSIESVCDKPMSLSGIEWTGWIFNNSRRI